MRQTFIKTPRRSETSVAKFWRWRAIEARVAVIKIASKFEEHVRFLAVAGEGDGEIPISPHRTRRAAEKACEKYLGSKS